MFTTEQIEAAHSKVRSGADFPGYIQKIKNLGVTAFETFTSDSHTVYFGNNLFKTQSGPQYPDLTIASDSKKELFIDYLKMHQQGKTDYFNFCKHCAETGIEKWRVSINALTCTYYDSSGAEILVEKIPEPTGNSN
jgi:uncharacterized protein YbcV (DUF1398 family)